MTKYLHSSDHQKHSILGQISAKLQKNVTAASRNTVKEKYNFLQRQSSCCFFRWNLESSTLDRVSHPAAVGEISAFRKVHTKIANVWDSKNYHFYRYSRDVQNSREISQTPCSFRNRYHHIKVNQTLWNYSNNRLGTEKKNICSAVLPVVDAQKT